MRATLQAFALVAALPAAALAQGPDSAEKTAALPTLVADARPVPAPAAPSSKPAPEPLPAAARPAISLSRTPTGNVNLGDKVTLTLTVTARAGDEVSVPKDQSFAPFELLRTKVAPPETKGDRTKQVFTLELIGFTAGDADIGPIRLRVVTKDGFVGFVESDKSHVSVKSAVANEPNAKPKPPSPPVTVMEDDYTLAYLGGAILLVALTALGTMFAMRWWRGRARPVTPPPPPRPPWDVARERLALLERDRTAAFLGGEERLWVDRLSDTMREYLGLRFGFDGLESTTDEILAWFRHHHAPGITVPEVATMLGDCDLVKFAKMPPDEAAFAETLRMARTMVAKTTPAEVFAALNAPASPPQPGASA